MSHAEDLAKVQQDGWALQYVKDQIPNKVDLSNPAHKPFYDLGWRDGDLGRICLAAVKQTGWALRYVKEQTLTICLAAIAEDGYALQFIKDLHSVADLINDSTIDEGLNANNEHVVLAYQKLVKIREANTITKRVNESVSSQPDKIKVRL